ncbi:MAG: AAA family ATPase [Acetobacteraceae bacterium]|nr:AAA family ATPase [Acetobacteraceae bacterium]
MADFLSQNRGPSDRTARELTGKVQSIVWSSDQQDYAIARLQSGEIVKGPIEDEPLEMSVVYRFLGRWETHARHGDQFAFDTFIRDTPHHRAGIIKYLIETCDGIGQRKAERLWELFGSEAVAVLRTEPERVAESGVITYEQALEAAEALSGLAALEKTRIDLFSLLSGRGFHGRAVAACIEQWGARAAEAVRRNPYAMLAADIPSAGFKRCDKLYLDLGKPKDRLKRQMLCAWNALREDSNGHTWFARGAVEQEIRRQIAGTKVDPLAALVLGKRGGWLATRRDPPGSERVWVAEAEKARKEQDLADDLRRLLQRGRALGRCLWPRELPSTLGRTGKSLTEHQTGKIYPILTAPICLLTGTPGTGKSFCAAAAIKQVVDTYSLSDVAVASPTGKAAVRLTAAMHEYGIRKTATTIHRLLEVGRNGHDGKGWGFQRNRHHHLNERFIFVDELSMLDVGLAADLFAACSDGSHIFLIGDPYQLPPVGHGAPLRDLIRSGVIPVAELTEIQRNDGAIVQACAAMKSGGDWYQYATDRPDIEHGKNLVHVETRDPAHSLETLLDKLRQFRATGEFDPVWDCQVVVPINAKSELCRVRLNQLLQQELNGDGERVDGNPFRHGDKVICLKNAMYDLEPAGDTYVANGEIGQVIHVDTTQTLIQFPLPERVIRLAVGKKRSAAEEENEDEAAEGAGRSSSSGKKFDLAYAVSCHKMQGSEARVVFVLADNSGSAHRVTNREWWYTAISRARRLCTIIGERATVERQCRRVSLGIRKTFLTELLTQNTPAQKTTNDETGFRHGG